MREEEDTPIRQPTRLERPPLDSWGIAELDAYIDALRAEIGRAEAEIGRKNAHRGAADAFFRRP